MSQDEFAKLQDEFMKLFKYMQREFSRVNDRLDQMVTKAEFEPYVNAVDAFAKQTEIYHHEMLPLGHIVDRHDRWAHKLAKAAGVKLSA